MVFLMMISGSISAQSLVSNVERDSAVAKILRGKKCYEQLVSANEVIVEADKTIVAAKNVIGSKSKVILNYEKQVKVFRDNKVLLNKRINIEKDIAKQYKKSKLSFGILCFGFGAVTTAVTLLL